MPSLPGLHASLATILVAVVGYGLGSIPFGLILTRLAGTQDIRSIGSGNIGATNVLRTGRKDLAAATLILDGLKGTLAVLLGWHFGPVGALAAAASAPAFRAAKPSVGVPTPGRQTAPACLAALITSGSECGMTISRPPAASTASTSAGLMTVPAPTSA